VDSNSVAIEGVTEDKRACKTRCKQTGKNKRLRWSRSSVLAFGTQVRGGSHPAEAVGFFRTKKILSTPSFGGEVKPSVPCRSFTACKTTLNGVEIGI